VFRDVDANREWEQEDKMVVKEGTRRAESAGDLIRWWAPGSEYDADVRWRRAVRASDLNLRWEQRWECYEAHIWVDRGEREERAGDLNASHWATS
jgi:hypothetical protein